ncbi:MAG: (4Fe-4S)-binding protein [Candidatus Cloacimonetes bacterium 4572_65]|nr:MAG: (4Fe-4S)-binding protein [Candidatus Cloacimonetes bacterium 4572_65]
MKEIVVISGKGGTGKTTFTSAFAYHLGEDCIVADCDVDAADMHLVFSPKTVEKREFFSGKEAVINRQLCNNCGLCQQKCRFDSIISLSNYKKIDPLGCEGCGYCARICPTNAIAMEDRYVGDFYISDIRTKTQMVHALLLPGGENSGKLVAEVKTKSREMAYAQNKSYVIVDGSPGIGCPVISSLSGAKYAVLVTEPTLSALHDLKRVVELLKKFNIKSGCIINKSDLNLEITEDVKLYLEKTKIDYLGSFKYSRNFINAVKSGLTINEYDPYATSDKIKEIWKQIEINSN